MKKKRVPIKRRFQLIVTGILIVSFVVTGALSLFGMLFIRDRGAEALVTVDNQNLANIVYDRALLANVEFDNYKKLVQNYAACLNKIFKNPENYKPKEVQPYDPKDPDIAGKYMLQIAYTRKMDESSGEKQRIDRQVAYVANLEDQMEIAMTSKDSDILTTYCAFEDGFMVSFDNMPEALPADQIFDFSESEWFTEMRMRQEVFFTDVYEDSFGRGLTITCEAPVYDKNDRYTGVICVDILISDVYRSIVSLNIGEGAYAMLVDSMGNLISADGESKNISELGLVAEEIEAVESGSKGVFLSQSGDYFASAHMESTGWTLLIKAPQELIQKPVRNMESGIWISIMVFVAILIVLLLIIMIMVRRFTNSFTAPLLALREDVKTISSGNLDHRIQAVNNDEVGDLAESFNDMAGSLDKYIKDYISLNKEQERLSAELSIAEDIQRSMLPTDFDISDSIKIYATMTPAKEMGGDFYDYFRIDDDHIGIVIADVSGKGVPAAMFMVVARTLIKIRTTAPGTPADVLYDVNNTLCRENASNQFVTVWFAILTESTGELICANAGHEYPALRHKGGAYELLMTDNMPPLATVEELEFVDVKYSLRDGDSLFLYTDGVIEAKNSQKGRFGSDRMLNMLNRDIDASPETILKDMISEIDSFVGEMEQFDDITMMSIVFSAGKGCDKL